MAQINIPNSFNSGSNTGGSSSNEDDPLGDPSKYADKEDDPDEFAQVDPEPDPSGANDVDNDPGPKNRSNTGSSDDTSSDSSSSSSSSSSGSSSSSSSSSDSNSDSNNDPDPSGANNMNRARQSPDSPGELYAFTADTVTDGEGVIDVGDDGQSSRNEDQNLDPKGANDVDQDASDGNDPLGDVDQYQDRSEDPDDLNLDPSGSNDTPESGSTGTSEWERRNQTRQNADSSGSSSGTDRPQDSSGDAQEGVLGDPTAYAPREIDDDEFAQVDAAGDTPSQQYEGLDPTPEGFDRNQGAAEEGVLSQFVVQNGNDDANNQQEQSNARPDPNQGRPEPRNRPNDRGDAPPRGPPGDRGRGRVGGGPPSWAGGGGGPPWAGGGQGNGQGNSGGGGGGGGGGVLGTGLSRGEAAAATAGTAGVAALAYFFLL